MEVGIIGLGNIGYALAEGFVKVNENILLFANDHNPIALQRAKLDFKKIEFGSNVGSVIEKSELILVCIRTAQVQKFLTDYSLFFTNGKIVVFMQAGIKNDFLIKSLKKVEAVVLRAITNINVSSLNGYTFVLTSTNKKANESVRSLFSLIGNVQMSETEAEFDSLSLLTGCSPALIAAFYDAMIESGISIGISKTQTEELIGDTIQQTLRNIKVKNLAPFDYMNRVCTKGGMVEATMKKLENQTNFKQDIVKWLPEISASLQQ